MPGRRGTLTVRVVSDTKAAEQGLDRFTTKVAATGDRMVDAGKKMTLFATVPVAAAMGAAVNAASDLQQAVGGTEAVFGDASDAIDRFADTAASSTGLSEREFREATTSIGGQLKRMTGDVDLASEQSIELTRVAADLAATYGGTTAEAVAALGSAFRGEADPAERFNLNLKVSAVNAKAVEMGLAASEAAVDDNARAQATLALIMEQSSDAQGQFAREADSAAGSMQVAKAEMEDAAAEIGTNLLPIVSDLAGGVAEAAERFGDLPEPVQTSVLALAGLIAVAGPLTAGIGGVINMVGKMRSGVDTAGDALDTMRLKSMYLRESLGPAGLVGSLGAVGALVGVGTVLYQDYAKTKAEAKRITDQYVDALRSEGDELDANVDKVAANELATKEYATAIRESGVGFDVLARGARESGEGLELLDDRIGMIVSGAGGGLRQALEDAGLSGTRLGDALTRLQGSMSAGDFADLLNDLDGLSDRYDEAAGKADNLDAAEKDVTGSTEDAGDAAEGAAPKVEELGTAAEQAKDEATKLDAAIRGVNDALRAQFDPLFAVTEALLGNRDAQQAVEEAHWKVTTAADELTAAIEREGKESWAAKDAAYRLQLAQQDLDEANRNAAGSAMDVATATNELKTRMDEGAISIEQGYRQLDQWTQQGLLTTDQAEQLKLEMFYAAVAADELGKRAPKVTLTLDAQQFWAELARSRAALAEAQWQAQLANPFTSRAGVPLRHTGGPVQAGRAYLTGGKGREELFVPSESGRVLSPARTERAMAGAGGGGGITVMPGASLVTLNGGDHDADSTAHHIARYLARR